jgi:tetratricopeptide (TPR) repeat protein
MISSRIVTLCALAAVLAVMACAPSQAVKPATEDELKAKREQAQASYSIGQQYFAQGDFESALKNFNEAVAIDSVFYEAYIAIGAVYRKQRDAANAEDWFRRALKVDPRRPKAYEGLGDLFLSMGQQDSALAVYLAGLKQDSTLVDLYNGAAEVYVRKNDWANAEATFKTAMRLFPDDQNVQRLWADFLYKQKRFKEAADALFPVIARFPKVATLRQRLVDVLIELKRYTDAGAQLDTIIQNDPNDKDALLRKGAVLMLQDKPKQAAVLFEDLIRRDSTKAQYHAYRAEALVQMGNSGAAETELRKAIALDPGLIQAWMGLGDIKRKSADQQRGTNLTKTPVSKLKAAKSLYAEARGHYGKGSQDPSYSSYASAQLDYIDKSVEAIDKELFVRDN